jgi:hypothetical protein
MGRLWRRQPRRASGARRAAGRRSLTPAVDTLEARQLLTGSTPLTPAVVVTSAATVDSRGVTVSYQVNTPPDPAHPLTFGVFRSADDRLDAGDLPVGTLTVSTPAGAPMLDLAGRPADAVGPHTLTIPLPGGLPPNPEHPFVIVAADPADALASGDPSAWASFRTYSLTVVVHGGIQNPHWASVPVWEGQMVRAIRGQGYDQVIPFNWVKVSDKPGYAAGQAPRLERTVLDAVAQVPAGEPVDLQLIGHSEGAVIVSQTLQRLGPQLTAELRGGYIQATLLDPHAANTTAPGQQYSVAHRPLSWLAKWLIDRYQSEAKDPPVVIPDWVNRTEVFFQHSTASRGDASNRHIYNLWGQVPIHGAAEYFDLTQDGVTHAGRTGVPTWYRWYIVPTLGNGEPDVVASVLTGSLAPTVPANGPAVATHQPQLTGHAAPGSTVRLYAAPANDPGDLSVVGHTTADAGGVWALTTRPLPDGRYRLLARSLPPRGPIPPRIPMIPTAPLGSLVIQAPPGS